MMLDRCSELVLLADLLLTALQVVADDDLAVAEPRRLRYTLLHVAARITNHARQTPPRPDLAMDPRPGRHPPTTRRRARPAAC
jgi:hypothetical protein